MGILSKLSSLKYWNAYAPVLGVLKDSRRYRALVDKANNALQLNSKDRVLELGTGTGNWLVPSYPLVGSVVSFEFSPAMIDRARENLGEVATVKIVQRDLNDGLPTDLGKFQKAVSIAVHGYLTNRQALTSQVAQALVPGGIFAMATPRVGAKFSDVLIAEIKDRWKNESLPRFFLNVATKLPLGIIAALIFGKIAQAKAKAGEFHFYAQDELEQEFIAAGLEVVQTTNAYASQYLLIVGRKPA